jgi:hypothetical protein
MPVITGEGSTPIWEPCHLDSYFPKKSGFGPCPGIGIYGPGGQEMLCDIYSSLYPQNVAPDREWVDGWFCIGSNEFTVQQTTMWDAASYALIGALSSKPGATGATEAPPAAKNVDTHVPYVRGSILHYNTSAGAAVYVNVYAANGRLVCRLTKRNEAGRGAISLGVTAPGCYVASLRYGSGVVSTMFATSDRK